MGRGWASLSCNKPIVVLMGGLPFMTSWKLRSVALLHLGSSLKFLFGDAVVIRTHTETTMEGISSCSCCYSNEQA